MRIRAITQLNSENKRRNKRFELLIHENKELMFRRVSEFDRTVDFRPFWESLDVFVNGYTARPTFIMELIYE